MDLDRSRLYPWALRALWAVLPFTAGSAFASALHGHSDAVRTSGSALLWGLWAATLCATLVLHPVSLTVLRIVAPAVVAGAVWAATGGASGLAAVGAVVWAVVVTVAALLPETGVVFVNGPAYPNERRFPLRPPGPLLLGPLELAWAVTAGAPVAAVLLLAARNWVLGGVSAVVGAGAIAVLGRALHGLSRRWVVFVPAGLVLHDGMTLADPVLFRRQSVESLALAPPEPEALDLTQRASGLALELDLREEATFNLSKPGQRVGPAVATTALLFSPTRPGRVLAEAAERRLV